MISYLNSSEVIAFLEKLTGIQGLLADDLIDGGGLHQSEQGGFPVSWQVNIYCLDQSVSNPDILFAGTEAGGIFKTKDRKLFYK